MKTWFTKEFIKASAVLLIVFIAGAGTGYISGYKYAEHRFQFRQEWGIASHGKPGSHARFRGRARGNRLMKRLQRDLNLTPAQQADVSRVLQQHHERIRHLRSQMRPQIDSILREIRQDVRSFLNNDQKTSFDDMVRRFEERMGRKFGRGRPGTPVSPAERP